MSKKFITLLIASMALLGTWLYAQKVPQRRPNAPPPTTNNAALTPAQTDAMVRTLRQSMTNSPGGSSNAPVTAPNTPVPATLPLLNAAPAPVQVALPSAGGTASPASQQTIQAIAPPVLAAPASVVSPTSVPAATPPAFAQPALNTNPVASTVPNPVAPASGPRLPGVPAAAPEIAAPDAQAAAEQDIIPAGMIQIQGMALDQFFEVYSMISGRSVLHPYALAGAPQGITLKAQTAWTRQEAIFAMDAVLALNGIAMIHTADKFVTAIPEQIAGTQGSKLSQVKTGNYTESDEFVTQIVTLKTVKPSELGQVLATFSKIPNSITPFDNNQTIVLREHASNVKRMLALIEKIDVVRESDYKLEVIPIKYGKVGDLYNTMASLISGQAGGGSAGGAPRAGRQTTRLGQAQQNSRQPGQALQPQQPPQSAGGAQNTFQNRLQQIVSRAAGGPEVQLLEDAKIVPDERSNKLLIFANKRDMEMITNIVAKVDVLLAQVLIEAIIMEVQLGDSQNIGVSVLQNPKRFSQDVTGAGAVNNGQSFLNNITNFPGALPSGFNYFGKIGNDLELAVKAIASDSTINVISRPRVQTSHAIPGTFEFVQTVPYPSGSYDSYGGYGGGFGGFGGGTPRTIIEKVDVGIRLGVTPFITPEGLVVMEITQEASQVGADKIIDGNPIPVINKRVAEATLTVRNRDTIMMGGFITESKTKNKSGVPILKDIPGLGVLFRSKNSENSRSELIILMRATVLETPEEAAITAMDEKSQLPGIQEAEKQFQAEDQKRLKKVKTSKR